MKQKLYAQRGATIMAALLFFLVAAVCGSIILAAATATASRITTQAEDARAYYSLTSAAQLVRDDLMNSRWKVVVKQTKSGASIARSYTISALDRNGNEDTKTFIPDLLIKISGDDDTSLFSPSDNMVIQTTSEGKELPLVYAHPDEITFKKLYNNYLNGDNTVLKLRMTNDSQGLSNGYRPSYKDGSKTRQVYWLELTLNSVKVPSGYVDKTDATGVGDIEFQIEWENVSIRKLTN